MITTLLLDIGGTMYVKNDQGQGQINPAINHLLAHLPKSITIVIVSDTELFNIPMLIARDFPILKSNQVFSRKTHQWVNKTEPGTYQHICALLHVNPSECLFIDNQPDFRSAAETAGITTYGVSLEEINKVLAMVFQENTLPNAIK